MSSIKEQTKAGAAVGERAGNVFIFIYFLRTLATCLITNTHYGSIYPTESIAVGGLIGDMLFFGVSGFCLTNIGDAGFFKWFGRRIMRIYPSVWLVAAIFALIGFRKVTSWESALRTFIYPTNYHFIASIVLLYIAFYIVMRVDILRKNIPIVMAVIAAVWAVCYIFFFDKTTRFDVAEIPMTKFSFFEIMLFGAYMRMNVEKFIGKNSALKWVCVAVSLVVYFLSKVLIDKYAWNNAQIVIMIFIFAVAASLMIAFCGIESKLPASGFIFKAVKFLAGLTLEIYIVQSFLIRKVGGPLEFPLNFIAVTLSIVLVAWVVNLAIKGIKLLCGKLFAKLKKA